MAPPSIPLVAQLVRLSYPFEEILDQLQLKSRLILHEGKSVALILNMHSFIGPLKPLLCGDKLFILVLLLYALESPWISCLEPGIFSLSPHLIVLKFKS